MREPGQGPGRVCNEFTQAGGDEAAQVPPVFTEHVFGRREVFFGRSDGKAFAIGVLVGHE